MTRALRLTTRHFPPLRSSRSDAIETLPAQFRGCVSSVEPIMVSGSSLCVCPKTMRSIPGTSRATRALTFSLGNPVATVSYDDGSLRPECRSTTGTMLAVTPSEDQVLKDGESLTFTITGGEGVPRLLLSGSTGTGENETKLNVSIVGGIVTATVKPGKTLPTGAVYLVITDANGKHREEIVITPQAVAPAGS